LKRILVLFAHPALQKSRINKALIKDIHKIDGVTFHDLYQAYPEFDIDVEIEKKLMVDHQVVIFHHPLFWYSTPAILKEWQDLVLEHGWAYGSKGDALREKLFFNVLTSGGRREAYGGDGHNHKNLRTLLSPIEQTATLCKMIYLPPFAVQGTHSINPEDIEKYREKYHLLLTSLRDDKIDISKAKTLDYLNDYFDKESSGVVE
jgi:glutathione-regulated potassium-efflux system ancillary protein KefG